jgi:hypothetical protein
MYASWGDLQFQNVADYTANASFTSEQAMISGVNLQPFIEAGFWGRSSSYGRAIRILMAGIVSSTGTPTYTFGLRLNPSSGTSVAGTSVGASAAITTGSGISNKHWYAQIDICGRVPGIGSTTATINCTGWVKSGGFAAPYLYELSPGGGSTATWTTTLDGSVAQYVQPTITCGTSSSSNTLTLKMLQMLVLN